MCPESGRAPGGSGHIVGYGAFGGTANRRGRDPSVSAWTVGSHVVILAFTMVCSNCNTESGGRYCPECGTALVTERCKACDAELPAGARFCTNCGESVVSSASAGATVAWWIAAVLVGLALAVFVLPALRSTSGGTAAAAAAGTQPGGGSMSPPPLTGTPREQADRLFNRVMEAFAAGDSADGRFFLPMAIDAYEMAAPLDADGLFHLSLLRSAAGEVAGGLSAAEEILAGHPDHLLGLAAAAQAVAGMGDAARAADYYRRFLEVYDVESVRGLPEYSEHAPMLPLYRQEAERVLRQ